MATTAGQTAFTFETGDMRARYDRDGWFHASDAVSDDVMQEITEQVAAMLGTGAGELGAWAYPDKKSQFLWELPEGLSADALCREVAAATGMDPETTVISERHLKVYSATAPEMPPPHKDRSASGVTVGIGVDIPEESRLVMWPDVDPVYNPYPTAAEWRETRHPEELPEKVTQGHAPVEVDLRRGDVVMFRGANLYHERYRPACTSVLYLKFNDLGLDPLGEDPRTVEAEAASAAARAEGIDPGTTMSVSPRLIGLRSDEFFPNLGTSVYARTIDSERAIRLTDEEADVLRSLATGGPAAVMDSGGVAMAERLVDLGLAVLS